MFGLAIDRDAKRGLVPQITSQLREAILIGKIKGGQQLPPTRTLAKEIKVARNVIIQVYEQLIAEGYLESRVGAGTFALELSNRRVDIGYKRLSHLSFAQSSSNLPDLVQFNPGTPDLKMFPRQKWAKHLREVTLDANENAFAYGPVEGEWELRCAVADYLFRTKDIDCRPEQVMIVSGTAQGTDLMAGLFREQSDGVIVEDPSDGFTHQIFSRQGFRIHPIPVDNHGMKTQELTKYPKVGLIYVVPSHQFPIGGVLPIGRRLELLEYAQKNDAYILEDDYDGEIRHRGEPIQSLRHLAPDRVVYMGTFSKIFIPGIRLGFLILPELLMDRLCDLKKRLNIRTSSLKQLAMARFIMDKSLERHVFKMKKIYAERRRYLINLLETNFGEDLLVSGESAGLHVLLTFRDCTFSPEDFKRFWRYGVEVDGVEDYALEKGLHRNQLVLGYGNVDIDQIDKGIKQLYQAIKEMF